MCLRRWCLPVAIWLVVAHEAGAVFLGEDQTEKHLTPPDGETATNADKWAETHDFLSKVADSDADNGDQDTQATSTRAPLACEMPDVPWSTEVSIGMPSEKWRPMAFEIELYSEKKDKHGKVMARMVQSQMAALKHSGTCSTRMFKVSNNPKKMKDGWVWETEVRNVAEHMADRATLWELGSPINLDEGEVELACRQTSLLEQSFKKEIPLAAKDDDSRAIPGLHVHVDSKCLLRDERRLVALLLAWDKNFEALQNVTASDIHARSQSKFSASLRKTFSPVYEHLETYIIDRKKKDGTSIKAWAPPRGNMALTQVFNEFEAMERSDDPHSGYRRLIVNVCHLLDVKCAHDYPEKNDVPKFGALEFRGFDPILGQGLRLVMTLLQRLVQVFCTKSLDTLLKLVTGSGDGEADVHELFKVLGVDDLMERKRFQWASEGGSLR